MGTEGDQQAKKVLNSILGWTIIPFRRISNLLSFLPPSSSLTERGVKEDCERNRMKVCIRGFFAPS